MTRILFGKAFTEKNMPQMGSAFAAGNFRALPVRVGAAFDGAWDFIVETWPTTVGFELGFGAVKRRATAFADVCAFFPEGEVFAREGGFGAFVD